MLRTPVRPTSPVAREPRTDSTRPSRSAGAVASGPSASAAPAGVPGRGLGARGGPGPSEPPPSGGSRSLSILIRVRGALPSLRPAEQRVAEAVLADPAGVSERSITSVARMCRTSETTVLRFCRALGLGGYPELRIALARAAQGEENDRARGAAADDVVAEGDSLADVVSKVTYADQRAVADTGAAVDLSSLEAAVDALAGARRIDVYGSGLSALVGLELEARLSRLGLAGHAWSDPHAALVSASGLRPGDVAVGISHTGSTADTLDVLRVARTRGATTVAVTNFDRSPIVAVSDIVLTTAARETTFRTGAMASRVSQLVVVDYLFTALALRSYERSTAALEAARDVLRGRHADRHDRAATPGGPGPSVPAVAAVGG